MHLRLRSIALVGLLCCASSSASLPAQNQVTVSLDVYFANGVNLIDGGGWELVALASDRGLAGVRVVIDEIESPIFMAPTGTVGSSEVAGFHETLGTVPFAGLIDVGWTMLFAQIPLDAPGPQTLFYDVGVPGGATRPGENGTPDVAGLVPQGVPWNLDDLLGDGIDGDASNNNGEFHNGVLLAQGSISPGADPSFVAAPAPNANVFTAVGTTTTAPIGDMRNAQVITMLRDSSHITPGDANMDGFVDASDLNIWNRNKFSTNGGWRNGDFNGDQIVDIVDFNTWNFNKFQNGMMVVPEPQLEFLLLAGWLAAAAAVRSRQ